MKNNKKCAAVAAILFVITSFLYLSGVLDRADYMLRDTFYQSYRRVDPKIFVIGIDAETLDSYGPWGSWSRMVFADLINYLNEDEETKPAVIGLDVMFAGNTTDREDSALVEAVSKGGNVVVTSQVYFFDEFNKKYTEEKIQRYGEPFDGLRAVAPSGMMNIFADEDGVVRHGIYQYDFEDKQIFSFAAQVVKEYAKAAGIKEPEEPMMDRNGQWVIPFVAKPGAYFGTGGKGTSWIRVMEQEIPRELFKDSIVLVGPYAGGLMDNHYTGADRSSPMYGIEVHANMVQSILEGNYKCPVPGYIAVLIVLILSMISYMVFSRWSIKRWTILTLVCVVLFLTAAWGCYQLGWILPLFYPMLTVALVYLVLLITNTIMLTVEKASLYDQMHQLFVDSIRTIATAIDAKDPCTSGHCQRVAEYSLLLGSGINCSKNDLADLEYSALLHDVGKIGISDNVLKKEGALTDEEYAEMKLHPMFGAKILGEIKEFSGRISEGAKYHHERFDGKGYCDGMAGEDIPLFGRIIAIADAYDAMTQNRPYRKRMSKEAAIEELIKNSGRQFDPHLVEVFVKLLKECPQPEETGPAPEGFTEKG